MDVRIRQQKKQSDNEEKESILIKLVLRFLTIEKFHVEVKFQSKQFTIRMGATMKRIVIHTATEC